MKEFKKENEAMIERKNKKRKNKNFSEKKRDGNILTMSFVEDRKRKKDEKMNTENNTLNAVDIVRKLVQRNADESINEQATLEVIQKAFEEIKSQDISNEQVERDVDDGKNERHKKDWSRWFCTSDLNEWKRKFSRGEIGGGYWESPPLDW
jgi:hypothetical protein